MFGFGKKKTVQNSRKYNPDEQIPVVKASICTGEKVAGFKDKATGKFEDVMLIRGEKDLQDFCILYGVERGEIKKEW